MFESTPAVRAGFNFLWTNPLMHFVKTKLEVKKDCPIQHVLKLVVKLRAYCMRPAMGGSDKGRHRKNNPNGNGFTAEFRRQYKRHGYQRESREGQGERKRQGERSEGAQRP